MTNVDVYRSAYNPKFLQHTWEMRRLAVLKVARDDLKREKPAPVTVPRKKTIGEVIAALKFPKGCTMPPWAREIVRTVADRNGVTVRDLLSVSRLRDVVAARSEAMYLVFAEKPWHPVISLPVVGKWFCGRDHTTVLFAIARHALDNELPGLTGLDVEKFLENKRRNSRESQKRAYWRMKGTA